MIGKWWQRTKTFFSLCFTEGPFSALRRARLRLLQALSNRLLSYSTLHQADSDRLTQCERAHASAEERLEDFVNDLLPAALGGTLCFEPNGEETAPDLLLELLKQTFSRIGDHQRQLGELEARTDARDRSLQDVSDWVSRLENQVAHLPDWTASHSALAEQQRQLQENAHRTTEILSSQVQTLFQYSSEHSRSLRFLDQQLVETTAPTSSPKVVASTTPRVSVILATWERCEVLANAIRSVQAQTFPDWELLVIDDGSTDRTRLLVEEFLHADPRILYLRQSHHGVSRARNLGLTKSRGDIVAYLDSDNTWYPRYLERVVEALDADADLDSVYSLQLVDDRTSGHVFHRGEEFDLDKLREANFIDLNVFAHRRSLYEKHGGFDNSMQRLVDWDLFLRLCSESSPKLIRASGCHYHTGGSDRISADTSFERAKYQICRKLETLLETPLRVLYYVHSYPQSTNGYIHAEIEYLRRRGVHVEVFSMEPPALPFESDVPVHRNTFLEAMIRSNPDVVHAHYLGIGLEQHSLIRRARIPLTYRGHSAEHSEHLVQRLLECPAVSRVYLYPHFARAFPSNNKVYPLPVGFCPRSYFPVEKDRRLVVRTMLAKATKKADTFLEVAKLCPDHRFVLIAGTPTLMPGEVKKIEALQRKLDSPAGVLGDLPPDEAARWVRSAGIVLHTYDSRLPFGMPISLADGLATGAYVLAGQRPEVEHTLGPCGARYSSVEEAADLIRATEDWSEERWRQESLRAVDHAYSNFADSVVYEALLQDWLHILGRGAVGEPRRRAA